MHANSRTRLLPVITLAVALAVAGCSSSDSGEIRGGASIGGTSPSVPTIPPGAPTANPSATATEVAPGIPRPSGAVEPSASPTILRSKDARQAAAFAQGMASAMLYLEPVFAPRDRPLSVVELQFISGLSINRLSDYYSWIINEATWRKNAGKVSGLVFIPPQDVEKRGYALPAVQRQNFTDLTLSEGPESSVDGSPTIKVSFTVSGDLMWVDASDVAWVAPLTRDITYVVAEQDGTWALDGWEPSDVAIGEARRATEEERAPVRFSLLDPYDWQGSDQPEPVPGL